MARFPIVLTLAASALAQNGFITALQGAGLTSFATALQSQSSLSSILSTLGTGSAGTVFAPSNAALANVSSSSVTADLLAYHIARGSFPASSIATTGDSIVRSYLQDGTNLPGGQGQVLVLGKDGSGNVQVRQGLSNATATATTTYQSVVIYTIPSVLSVPADLATTATAAGLSSLSVALQQVLPGVIEALEQVPGITVLAPVNSALSNLPGLLSSIPANTIQNILANHVLNGTTLYSPSLSNGGEVISASGEILTFLTNATGTYIKATNSTVQVLIPDVPISNGVVHVVSGVLIDTSANSQEAAVAYSSAQANAPTSAQTGFVSATLATSIAVASPTSAKSDARVLVAPSAMICAGIGLALYHMC